MDAASRNDAVRTQIRSLLVMRSPSHRCSAGSFPLIQLPHWLTLPPLLQHVHSAAAVHDAGFVENVGSSGLH